MLDSKLRYLEERTKKYIKMVLRNRDCLFWPLIFYKMELTYNSFANSAVLSPEGLNKKNIVSCSLLSNVELTSKQISVALKATSNVLQLAQVRVKGKREVQVL
jgi:hypothetical protein